MKKKMIAVHCLMLTLLACAEAEKTGGLAPSTGAVIVCSDYSSGTLAHLTLGAGAGSWSVADSLELVSGDPAGRSFGPRLYVINRFGADNIQIPDPNANFKTRLQYSVGNKANPHDILEISPAKAYVSRFDTTFNDLLVVNPGTGETLGTIPLNGLAGLNSTASARPNTMALHEGKVFVTLQNISEDFSEYGSGLLAVVDSTRDALVDVKPATPEIDAIDLGVKSPDRIAVFDGQVFVTSSGRFPNAKAGFAGEAGALQRVDPVRYSVTTLIGGDSLEGGSLGALALAKSDLGYVALGQFDYSKPFEPRVLRFNPKTGALGAPIYTAKTNSGLPDLALDSFGFLHILDGEMEQPGVVIVNTTTGGIEGRFKTALPPVSISILSAE